MVQKRKTTISVMLSLQLVTALPVTLAFQNKFEHFQHQSTMINNALKTNNRNNQRSQPNKTILAATRGRECQHFDGDKSASISRSSFLQHSLLSFMVTSGVASGILSSPSASNAFEGGVGGLGKTKPETGVAFFNPDSLPIQNSKGEISAEIVSSNNQPLLVQFQTPWPLLSTTSGLEARDLRQPESAYIQVVNKEEAGDAAMATKNPKLYYKKLITDTVLGQQGKFGAYGTPTDIKFSFSEFTEESIIAVTFTAYTPSMIETVRKMLIKVKDVGDNTVVLLVTGTTNLRYSSQEKTLRKVLNSFDAVLAPKTNLAPREKFL